MEMRTEERGESIHDSWRRRLNERDLCFQVPLKRGQMSEWCRGYDEPKQPLRANHIQRAKVRRQQMWLQEAYRHEALCPESAFCPHFLFHMLLSQKLSNLREEQTLCGSKKKADQNPVSLVMGGCYRGDQNPVSLVCRVIARETRTRSHWSAGLLPGRPEPGLTGLGGRYPSLGATGGGYSNWTDFFVSKVLFW